MAKAKSITTTKIAWLAAAAGVLYCVHKKIKGAVSGIGSVENTVQAKEIYDQVLQKVWKLRNSGEITIIYGYGLGDYFNVYMYGEEYIEGVVIDWNGKQKKVKLPDKNAINNDKIVARAIMSGFAQLYLGKNVDPYKKPSGTGVVTATGNEKVTIREAHKRRKEFYGYVIFKDIAEPNESQVWWIDYYDPSYKEYVLHNCADTSKEKYVKGDKTCYVGFYY